MSLHINEENILKRLFKLFLKVIVAEYEILNYGNNYNKSASFTREA